MSSTETSDSAAAAAANDDGDDEMHDALSDIGETHALEDEEAEVELPRCCLKVQALYRRFFRSAEHHEHAQRVSAVDGGPGLSVVRVEEGFGPSSLRVEAILCQQPKVIRPGVPAALGAARYGVLIYAGDRAFDLCPGTAVEKEQVTAFVKVAEPGGKWQEQPGLADVLVLQHSRLAASRLCIHDLGRSFELTKKLVEAEVNAERYWPPACMPATDSDQFIRALDDALWHRIWRPVHGTHSPAIKIQPNEELRTLFLCDDWGTRLPRGSDAPVVALWHALRHSGAATDSAENNARAMAALLAASARSQAARVLFLCMPFSAPDAVAVAEEADRIATLLVDGALPAKREIAVIVDAILFLCSAPRGAKMCDPADCAWVTSLQPRQHASPSAPLATIAACFADGGAEKSIARLIATLTPRLMSTKLALESMLQHFRGLKLTSLMFWREFAAAAVSSGNAALTCDALQALLYTPDRTLREEAKAMLADLAMLPASILLGIAAAAAGSTASMPATDAALPALVDFCMQFEQDGSSCDDLGDGACKSIFATYGAQPPTMLARLSLGSGGSDNHGHGSFLTPDVLAKALRYSNYAASLGARYVAAASAKGGGGKKGGSSESSKWPWVKSDEGSLRVMLAVFVRTAWLVDPPLLSPLTAAFQPGALSALLHKQFPGRGSYGGDPTPPVRLITRILDFLSPLPSFRGVAVPVLTDAAVFTEKHMCHTIAFTALQAPAKLLPPSSHPNGPDGRLLLELTTLALRMPRSWDTAPEDIASAWRLVFHSESSKTRLESVVSLVSARIKDVASSALTLADVAAFAVQAETVATTFNLRGVAMQCLDNELLAVLSRAPPVTWLALAQVTAVSALLWQLQLLGGGHNSLSLESCDFATSPRASNKPQPALFQPHAKMQHSSGEYPRLQQRCVFDGNLGNYDDKRRKSTDAREHRPGAALSWHNTLWAPGESGTEAVYDRLVRVLRAWTAASRPPTTVISCPQPSDESEQRPSPPLLWSFPWMWADEEGTEAQPAKGAAQTLPDRYLLVRLVAGTSSELSLGTALLIVHIVKALKRKVYVLHPGGNAKPVAGADWTTFLANEFGCTIGCGLTRLSSGVKGHASSDDDVTLCGGDQLPLFYTEYVGTAGGGVTRVVVIDERVAAAANQDEVIALWEKQVAVLKPPVVEVPPPPPPPPPPHPEPSIVPVAVDVDKAAADARAVAAKQQADKAAADAAAAVAAEAAKKQAAVEKAAADKAAADAAAALEAEKQQATADKEAADKAAAAAAAALEAAVKEAAVAEEEKEVLNFKEDEAAVAEPPLAEEAKAKEDAGDVSTLAKDALPLSSGGEESDA